MRLARYIRLSTEEQARDSQALDRQLFSVNKSATEILGNDPPDDLLFIDLESGRKSDRPQYQQLVQLIKRGEIDILIIDRNDRLGRDLEELARVGKLLEKTKTKLYECLRGLYIDFQNPSDWEYFASSAVSSEGESRKISRRVTLALEYSRHKGKPNSNVPFGYVRENDRYVLNQAVWEPAAPLTQAQVARRMIDIFFEEQSNRRAIRRIAQECGKVWSSGGLPRWLRNEVLRGHTGYFRNHTKPSYEAGEIRWNTHPDQRLLSEAEYQEIQQIFDRNRRYRGRNARKKPHPLAGLLYCDRCGASCQRYELRKGTHLSILVYCEARRLNVPGAGCVSESSPGRKGMRYQDLMDEIKAELALRADTLVLELANDLSEANERIDPEIARLEQQIKKISALAQEIGDEDKVLQGKIQGIRQQIAQKKNAPTVTDEALKQELITYAELLQDELAWELMTNDEQRQIFTRFVRRVLIDRDRVTAIELRV